MSDKRCVHVGVDVGGTNTDAVVMCQGKILGLSKKPTTKDVTRGICNAVTSALLSCYNDPSADRGPCEPCELEVMRIHIGTTHFVNAVAQKQDLAPVAVIRLCTPASTALPPFSDFPEDIQKIMAGPIHMVGGGYYYDGIEEISQLNKEQVSNVVMSIKSSGIRNIVVSGIFSPVNNKQELKVAEWLTEMYPEASFTLSSTIAQLNILLRENSAIMNESLKPLAHKTIDAIRNALDTLKLHCPFYFTQNDGTLLSAEKAKELPVLTFASGPTNSMRGAAFLSGEKHGVVVDIGGTSTDAGMLINGFPRQASSKVQICRVQTNFQMPDTISIALGGGSVVKFVQGQEEKVMIGPKSVGYNIQKEGIVFGGHTLTATDIAVAADIADVGTFQHQLTAHYIPEILVKSATGKIKNMVETLIDSVKTSEKEVPIILVGGGTILIDDKWKPSGFSKVSRPPHYEVANAVGAALSQVSGNIDTTKNLSTMSREEAVNTAKQQAIDIAIKEGADPESVEIIRIEDIPLTYIPGTVTRLLVKAVGDLFWETDTRGIMWHPDHAKLHEESTDHRSVFDQMQHLNIDEEEAIPKDEIPNIDPVTGEWHLSRHDIESLSIGTGILGCGGGGSTLLGKLAAIQLLKQGKKVKVINPERFCHLHKPDDCVLSLGFMGAPTVLVEMLFNEVDISGVVQAVEDIYTQDEYKNGEIDNKEHYDITTENGVKYIKNYKPKSETPLSPETAKDRRIKALTSAEIGGCNGMIPLFIGALLDIPVLDCDLMGRAFPELQMVTTSMNGCHICPSAVSDCKNRKYVCLETDTPKHLEDVFRKVCVEFGCLCGFGMGNLTVKQMPGNMVYHSTSRAWRLGQAVLHSRQHKKSPVAAILEFERGELICEAKISDVVRNTTGGFARGQMKLEGFGDFNDKTYSVEFQNENLIAKDLSNGKIIATVPSLITVVDHETGEPIPTDEVRYGLRVAVLALPAPPILATPHALAIVGPKALGYENVEYTPVGEYVEHKPIPPP